jgi:hypothetical protein
MPLKVKSRVVFGPSAVIRPLEDVAFPEALDVAIGYRIDTVRFA